MLKRVFIISFLGIAGWAQVSPPGTISSAPRVGTTQQPESSGTFTNRSGASFSTAELASQLQQLRTLVDQTLPVLSAYTETVSNTAGTGNHTLGGAVTDILSGVLNRQGNQQAGGATGNHVFSSTNVVNVLQGLLTTNSTGSSSGNKAALKDFADMQNQLQALNATLQRLNITGTTNSAGNLTPTGR
jgi:hypothetical protein